MATAQPHGIRGLEGREPVGACVAIGRKGDRGQPIENDRFFFVLPHAEGSGQNAVRAPHPAFGVFNSARPEQRRVLYGNIVHARESECFERHLKAQVLTGQPGHPDKRPACVGDGDRAVRWFPNDPNDFREIPCPNDACEFRQGKACCKPWMRFLFRPLWSAERQGLDLSKGPLPSPLVKLTSASWNSTAAFIGLFRYVEAQARAFGIRHHSLFGLPIMITLGRKTKPSEQRSFPVMSVTVDGDLQAFLWAQRERRLAIDAAPVAAITDDEQQDPAEVHRDFVTISPGLPDRGATP